MNSSNILTIIERTLNHVDMRMAGHGKRVSFLVHEVLAARPWQFSAREVQDASVLALVHDIGAYKTSDITNLLSFESHNCMEHALYGALFLKAFSSLSDKTDSVLYHHLPATEYSKIGKVLPQDHLAGLICLCDRLELLSRSCTIAQCLSRIQAARGTVFTSFWVDAFCKANDEYHILENLYNKEYESIYSAFAKHVRFSQSEKAACLETLAYFIDFRSEFMVLHTVTTVSIAMVLGEMFAFDSDAMRELQFGALLHDIGKVATPVEILEKPGRLDEKEAEIMQKHVSLSREILHGCVKESICKIACRHHEKLDGSGYPDGLTSTDLSLSERMVAVADVTSALIRKRSYKAAFDKAETIQILLDMANAGKLCPQIVALVLDKFDEIMIQAQKNSEDMTMRYTQLKNEYQRIMLLIENWDAL